MSVVAKAGCPICDKPVEPTFRPFCSKRCADIDLGRWFNERYVVPEPLVPDEESGVDEGEGGEARVIAFQKRARRLER